MRALVITILFSSIFSAASNACQRHTGGTCSALACQPWRNAVCVGSRFCDCNAPHTCNNNGECVVAGDCPKFTGGTCGFLDCDGSRKATCIGGWGSGYCMCAADECVVNGNCAPKNEAWMLYANMTESGQTNLARSPGEHYHVKNFLAVLSCLSLLSAGMGVAFLKKRINKDEPLLSNFAEFSD